MKKLFWAAIILVVFVAISISFEETEMIFINYLIYAVLFFLAIGFYVFMREWVLSLKDDKD